MPEVYLDNSPIEFEDTGAVVKELVDALARELGGLKRVITGVEVDGSLLPDLHASPALSGLISSLSEIRVTTASIESMALAGLDVLREYIMFIDESIQGCVRGLRLGEGVGQRDISTVLEGVAEVIKTLDAVTRSGAAAGDGLSGAGPVEGYRTVLACLEAIDGARRAGDAILIADVLEYELALALEEISSKFNTLSGA